MASRKRYITPSERRHQDYLRKKTLRAGTIYESRLIKLRRKELKRVLAMARDYNDAESVADLLENSLDESSYLQSWWTGLWSEAGVPHAQTVARELREAKAAGENDIWISTLRRYASARAGNEIVSVTGTWKRSLVTLLRDYMSRETAIGVEKLTRKLYEGYMRNLEKWQCRRIAQTEAMIGMSEAGNLAARTLDIPFTKQWCISGLGNTRESHEAMDGVIVDENEPFILPGGLMMYPHDTSMGADASEIINCACACIRRPKDALAEVEKDPEEQRIQSMMNEMSDDLSDDTKRALALNNISLEEVLGVKKGARMSIAKADKQSANPKYIPEFIKDPKGNFIDRTTGERFSKNPKYNGNNKRYHVNCATCTPAYELRRRGFDVKAKGRIKDKGDHNDWVAHGHSFDIWQNADGTAAKPTLLKDFLAKNKYTEVTKDNYKKFLEESTKEKGTYTLTIYWKKGSGHATVLERKPNGKLVHIEPQAYDASKGVERSIDALCARVNSSARSLDGIMRMDDKVFKTEYADLFTLK